MPMSRLIKLGVLFFWAAYFTLVLASNAADALRTSGLLPETFPFVSGNYELIERVTRIYAIPAFGVAALFAGVLLWQLAASALFWQSFARFRSSRARRQRCVCGWPGSLGGVHPRR
jgi:hypothetical protein